MEGTGQDRRGRTARPVCWVAHGVGKPAGWARRVAVGMAAALLVQLAVPAVATGDTAGETVRVSVASDGTQANQGSGSASVSAGGRHIAFHSTASNLVANDTNGHGDVFVHDRWPAPAEGGGPGPLADLPGPPADRGPPADLPGRPGGR